MGLCRLCSETRVHVHEHAFSNSNPRVKDSSRNALDSLLTSLASRRRSHARECSSSLLCVGAHQHGTAHFCWIGKNSRHRLCSRLYDGTTAAPCHHRVLMYRGTLADAPFWQVQVVSRALTPPGAAVRLNLPGVYRGQDETSLFITVYAPGMAPADAQIGVNDTHFSITGPNPAVPPSSPTLARSAHDGSPVPRWQEKGRTPGPFFRVPRGRAQCQHDLEVLGLEGVHSSTPPAPTLTSWWHPGWLEAQLNLLHHPEAP
jgi:hypothetical protein